MILGSQPRIAPLPREEWTDDARDVFAFWEGEPARENGSRSNTMMTLANHPPLALASLQLGRYFMLESTLTARQQKTIVLRVAARTDSQYQWEHNALSALQLGMSETEIAAIRHGLISPVLQGEDRLLVKIIDLVCDGAQLDDATWSEMTAAWDRRQIMDVLHAIGYFNMVAWGLVAMRVQLEPDFGDSSRNFGKTS